MKRTVKSTLKDIKEHPEKHRHNDVSELIACCVIDGAISLRLLDAHNKNRHDVESGPCACGSWH